MVNIPFLKKKKKEKNTKELREEYVKSRHKFFKKVEKVPSHKKTEERLKSYGFHPEVAEIFQHRFIENPEFPHPERRFRLVLEYPNFNVENTYYWFTTFLQETWGFDKAEKVVDSMTASVSSSSFANLQTRIAAQQSQASQYLKGISEMVKGLFQIVREIRVIDQRLQYYYDSDRDVEVDAEGKPKKNKKGKPIYKGDPNNALSSEIVLKGLWIDQVEGGAKNPASVYGLAQTIGFTVLPDLFFRIEIKDSSKMEEKVDELKFNKKVKEVLKRKLRQYYVWKELTKKELEQRRAFEINYLRQHYETIRLYMSWVKPYLKNIRDLRMHEKNRDHIDLVKSFETQIMELETIFYREDFHSPKKEHSEHHVMPVISVHIFYRVRPDLGYHHQEYQHKGPIHVGLADITIRAYVWDTHKLHNYVEFRQHDDLDLLSEVDKSVANSMDALGDELRNYLKEADPTMVFPGEKPKKEEKKDESKVPDILDPFVSVFKGFGEIAQSFTGGSKKKKKKTEQKPLDDKAQWKHDKAHGRAHHFAEEAAWETYERFKMGPGGNLYWIQ